MEREARLAIDVESGDSGTKVILDGVFEALERSASPFRVLLCGDPAGIERGLEEKGRQARRFRDAIAIVPCTERVPAGERRRSRIWKTRSGSSIIRCISLQKEKKANASISAGDTAVLLGASLFLLGRKQGALRPALAAFLPTVKKQPTLLLDVGANLNCRSEHLVSFAAMGRAYVKAMYDEPSPSIALLNVGSESVKGTAVIGEADRVLRKKYPAEYRGFIEGNRVLSGDADVIVCDGFSGNVLLKAFESFHDLVGMVLEKKPGLLDSLRQHTGVLNPENYGAAPFLGIRGTVLKAHGSSSSRAIAIALLTAERTVRSSARGPFLH